MNCSGELDATFSPWAPSVERTSSRASTLTVSALSRATIGAGVPDFEITSWFGLMAPAGTPAPIIARLNAETVKVLAREDVRSTLGAQGLNVASSSPEQFTAHIKSEIARFTRIARAAGIKVE